MIISATDCLYVKERLTGRSDWTGYNAPAMAFDSRQICLMELFTGNSGLFDDANIVKKVKSAKKSRIFEGNSKITYGRKNRTYPQETWHVYWPSW
jgi:hypothetical protein